jgi:hypothetical protein
MRKETGITRLDVAFFYLFFGALMTYMKLDFLNIFITLIAVGMGIICMAQHYSVPKNRIGENMINEKCDNCGLSCYRLSMWLVKSPNEIGGIYHEFSFCSLRCLLESDFEFEDHKKVKNAPPKSPKTK